MNNEETKVLNQNATQNAKSNSGKGGKIALAAGGLAVGAGVGVAGSQLAGEDIEVTPEAPKEEKVVAAEKVETIETTAEVVKAPAPVAPAPVEAVVVEQASVEQASVEQASVEQVVVEQASVEQVAVEQASVEAASVEQVVVEQVVVEQVVVEQVVVVDPNTNPTNSEGNNELVANNDGNIDVTPVNPVPDATNPEGNNEFVDGSDQGDIKILGEVDNSQTVQVDIDNSNMLSGIPFDENCGEAIAENEIDPIQDSDINMTDLQEHLGIDPTTENFMAYEGEMPDYVNDADISSLA